MPRDGIRQPRPDIARAFSEGSGVALDGEEEAGSLFVCGSLRRPSGPP